MLLTSDGDFPEPSFLPDCTILLGVKREVTASNADCIMPGWIFGSSNSSFTFSILQPSDCPISTWCSTMGLVGVVMGVCWDYGTAIGGATFMGWDSLCVCVCTLFLLSIEFHKSFESMASTWVPNVSERGMGFPIPSYQSKPSVDIS